MKNITDNILDDQSIWLISDIFKRTYEIHEDISARRYRANNIQHIHTLDYLESKHLILRDQEKDTYRIHSMSLIFLENESAIQLLSDIDRVIDYLRASYKENMNEPVTLNNISDDLRLSRQKVTECLTYLRDAWPLAGSTDLLSPNALIHPEEDLFKFTTLRELFTERLPLWFPNILTDKSTNTPHKNTERFASQRVEVLGAALFVLAKYRAKCCTKTGKPQGTKIARMIDEKSLMLFDSDDGEPPLSRKIMEELINNWLNKVEK